MTSFQFDAIGTRWEIETDEPLSDSLCGQILNRIRLFDATNPISRDYQERFADAIPVLVVGKPIDEANVSRVAGSSGTPDGFNAAIEQIKRQASN